MGLVYRLVGSGAPEGAPAQPAIAEDAGTKKAPNRKGKRCRAYETRETNPDRGQGAQGTGSIARGAHNVIPSGKTASRYDTPAIRLCTVR